MIILDEYGRISYNKTIKNDPWIWDFNLYFHEEGDEWHGYYSTIVNNLTHVSISGQ